MQHRFLTSFLITLTLGVAISSVGFAQRARGSAARTVPAAHPPRIHFCGEPVPIERATVAHNLSLALMRNVSSQNHLLNFRRRALAQFFPVIEPMLRKYGIPDDFKYLAVVESGLKADAVSHKGAVGYWQLMSETALELGLTISAKADERKDLLKSTDAACRYLRILHRNLGSWTMVAAAYNGGIGRMQSHMRKQRETNYYFLSMNPETSEYLYKIVAVKEFFQFPVQYMTTGLMASLGNEYERERAEASARGLIPADEPDPVGIPIGAEWTTETASVDSLLGALSKPQRAKMAFFKGEVEAELVKPGKLAVGQTWQFRLVRDAVVGEQQLGQNDRLFAVVDDIDPRSGQLFLRATKLVSAADSKPYSLTLICLNPYTGLAGVPLPQADQLKPNGRGWKVL